MISSPILRKKGTCASENKSRFALNQRHILIATDAKVAVISPLGRGHDRRVQVYRRDADRFLKGFPFGTQVWRVTNGMI